MSETKRFYWIKLQTSFYSDENGPMSFLLGQPNGADFVVIYQMLCLMTANKDGALAYSFGKVLVPYDVDKITRECKYFSRETVIFALELFKKIGLVYEEVDGVFRISNFDKIVGSETSEARKKRLQRSREITDTSSKKQIESGQEGDKRGDKKGTMSPQKRDNVPQTSPEMSGQCPPRDKRLEIRDKRTESKSIDYQETEREVSIYTQDNCCRSLNAGAQAREDDTSGEGIESNDLRQESEDNLEAFNRFVKKWDIQTRALRNYSGGKLAGIDWDAISERVGKSDYLQKQKAVSFYIDHADEILDGKYFDYVKPRGSPKSDSRNQGEDEDGYIDPDYDWRKFENIHYD